jgi:hypothetical protein
MARAGRWGPMPWPGMPSRGRVVPLCAVAAPARPSPLAYQSPVPRSSSLPISFYVESSRQQMRWMEEEDEGNYGFAPRRD